MDVELLKCTTPQQDKQDKQHTQQDTKQPLLVQQDAQNKEVAKTNLNSFHFLLLKIAILSWSIAHPP